jgi:ribosomal protein S18 acetylase RimI-like enzyme
MRFVQRAHDTIRRFTGRMHLPLASLFILLLSYPNKLEIAHAQDLSSVEDGDNPVTDSVADPCEDPSTPSALREDLQLVCARERVEDVNRRVRRAIIIGFVGGYVKRDDLKHPEVLFANYLRRRYGPAVYAAIFGNHEGKKALEDIIRQFDKHDHRLSTAPEQVKIILYGHSWGASQMLAVARELQRRGIPAALTIQVDSVKKLGFRQDDRTVPANVAKAVNFYQRKGLTPGQPLIVPADATRTTILGNFHMTYEGHEINIDNYRWFSRVFNKHHHEIENDPRVWVQIASLIDLELLRTNAEIRAASSTESPPRRR